MSRASRQLIAVALAVLVVVGMVVADVATLRRAKPSFDQETQDVRNLLAASTTTTLPPERRTGSPVGAPVTSVNASTTIPAASRNPSTTTGGSASP